MNSNQLRIYQFDKPISDTLEIERLHEKSLHQILKQNGLRHYFFIDFEMITIGSFETDFIKSIETNPDFENRIAERKRNLEK